jgi:hypothetical protein
MTGNVLLIPCGGQGRRWQNYQGVPKPMISVDGETLVKRTARLFRSRVSFLSVYLIGTDPRLAFQGIQLVPPDPDALGNDFDKLACGWSRWSTTGRTWIVWADVYLTTLAVEWMTRPGLADLAWYGRLGPSRHTGKPYAELWGLSFLPEAQGRLGAAIANCSLMYQAGDIPRALAWSVYEKTSGLKVCSCEQATRDRGRGFECIDDRTEDFDYPHDLDTWLATQPRGSGVEVNEHADATAGRTVNPVPLGPGAELRDRD